MLVPSPSASTCSALFDIYELYDPRSIILKLRRLQSMERISESEVSYVHFLLGQCFSKLHDLSQAYRHYQECHRCTQSKWVQLLMCQLSYAMALQKNIDVSHRIYWIQRASEHPTFEVASKFLKAKLLLESGHLEAALKVYCNLCKTVPIVETSIICARLYAKLRQYSMTSIYLGISLQRNPSHPGLSALKQLLSKLAIDCKQAVGIYLHSKQYEAALKKVHQGLEWVPDDVDLVLLKAEALMHLAKEEEALDLIKSTNSLAATTLKVRLYHSWVRRGLEKYAEALPLSKTLCHLDESYISLQCELLIKLKQFDEVIKLNPKEPSSRYIAYIELGNHALALEHWTSALDHFENAWSLSRSPSLALVLAETYLHVDRNKSLTYLNEALNLDPDHPQVKMKYYLWVTQFDPSLTGEEPKKNKGKERNGKREEIELKINSVPLPLTKTNLKPKTRPNQRFP